MSRKVSGLAMITDPDQWKPILIEAHTADEGYPRAWGWFKVKDAWGRYTEFGAWGDELVELLAEAAS